MVDFGIIGELPVPATYGRHLLRLFEPDKLLAGTGLTAAELEQPGRLITVRQALQYVRNTLNLATEADWYLGWSSSLADHFHGPVSIALLSAPTLGHGIDAFLKHFPSRIPYMHMQGRTRGSVFMAELVPLIDLEEAAPLLIETPLLLLQQHLDNVYGVDFSQASLELAYPPTPHAARYSQYFKCPIHFDAEHNALVFPTAWRELANLGYIESTWAHALSQCRATVASSRERETLGEVRERLCAAFECAHRTRPLPTLNELADRLHLAPRTLIRRLRRLGTTYQEITDEFLLARAQELLTNHGISIKEVAARLGFNNPANFGKAFKRWSGVSPGQYRAQRIG
jgi:AraC-like DNA-binding protein